MYIASDAIALAPLSRTISHLEDGDLAVVQGDSMEVRDSEGRIAIRPPVRSTASATVVDKGNYRHFMIKEIHEQPEAVNRTFEHYIDSSLGRIELPVQFDFASVSKLSILACGTAYHAAFIARYWFENMLGFPWKSPSHPNFDTAQRR
jgi:glutamine---fructose-6-phosphate transaminase (isomerizing)